MEVDQKIRSISTVANGLDEKKQKIIDLVKSAGKKGIFDADIIQIEPVPQQRVDIINDLLRNHIIKLFRVKEKNNYKYNENHEMSVTLSKNITSEEKLVYDHIAKAGGKGIWNRELKTKTGVPDKLLNKMTKSLASKKVIKIINSVQEPKKKLFMLYHLKPSTSITGGPWYTNQEFDEGFVSVLNQQCYLYLEQKREKAKAQDLGPLIEKNASFAPSADVLKYIMDMGLTTQKLEVTDVEMILDSLVYDGKVERVTTSDGNNMYRAIARLVEGTGLVKSPCGLCPVRKNCSDVGNITPITCQYFGEWLSY
ncbi:hypothetical protein TKK_0000841 [Trichogramma kaykai]|uniref:DNA-directed RNA polymerase III subunit RPC6 n=1 Tax=Trichogramma kaykai TaxID=54128 RepID=A0ABD2VWS2_9HYME